MRPAPPRRSPPFCAPTPPVAAAAHTAVNKKAVEVVKDDFITSKKKGPDAGSTYYVVTCRSCSNMIGRSYQTTAKALDHVR